MMPSIMKQSRFKNILRRAAVALLWLAVWQLAAAAVGKELLIPYPRAVFFNIGGAWKNSRILARCSAHNVKNHGRICFGANYWLGMRGIIGAISRFQGYFRAHSAPYTRSSRSFLYNFSARMDKKCVFVRFHIVFNGFTHDMVKC